MHIKNLYSIIIINTTVKIMDEFIINSMFFIVFCILLLYLSYSNYIIIYKLLLTLNVAACNFRILLILDHG